MGLNRHNRVGYLEVRPTAGFDSLTETGNVAGEKRFRAKI
jgi:hypothetical protein